MNEAGLGARLRDVRLAIKVTQKEMAERVGLTVSTLSDLERGKIKRLSERNAILLRKEFGINPNWLRTGFGPMFTEDDRGLDKLAADAALTELEVEVLSLYMRLAPDVRQKLLADLVASISKMTGKLDYSRSANDAVNRILSGDIPQRVKNKTYDDGQTEFSEEIGLTDLVYLNKAAGSRMRRK